MSRLSLAQQLAQLSEPTPTDLDPEDIHAGVYAEENSAIDDSAARQHYVDVAPSAIRKTHESVSDPKYDGVRTTRKQLLEDLDQEDSDEEGGFLSGADSIPEEGTSHSDSDSEEAEASSNGSQAERLQRIDSLSDVEDAAPSHPTSIQPAHEPQEDDDLASSLRKTREEDRKKGEAVTRQIALWDALLDTRIQLQKVASTSARLPSHVHLHSFVEHPSAHEAVEGLSAEAAALSEELFAFQESLLEHNEGVNVPPRKRQKTSREYDPADRLQELSADASALEASYHAHLVQTLAKWSAKVQAVAPGVLLGSRTSFNKNKGKLGVVTMVDEMLRTDGAKLLSRTRTRRSKAPRLRPAEERSDGEGSGSDDKEDMEVFDDTDFYQQLLRDVIRARGTSDAQAGEQEWVAQQRERKAKRKLRVDTKASKGRKLRYEVHAKLQNFMVPVPVTHGEWHDEQIDGLFSSLLGAG
ncbi:apoptosis-antagonizing transcription factor [Amylocystis lapponica]|nr:apoptosis-antagonizing transcription factor [Amylocystis lapponica]